MLQEPELFFIHSKMINVGHERCRSAYMYIDSVERSGESAKVALGWRNYTSEMTSLVSSFLVKERDWRIWQSQHEKSTSANKTKTT